MFVCVCVWFQGSSRIGLVPTQYPVSVSACVCLLLIVSLSPPQSSMESPNLEFEYGDTDSLTAELSGEKVVCLCVCV